MYRLNMYSLKAPAQKPICGGLLPLLPGAARGGGRMIAFHRLHTRACGHRTPRGQTDHAVVYVAPFLARKKFHEVALNGHGVGFVRKPQPIGNALHMRVNSQPLIDAKCAKQHHIGRFAGNTGNGNEVFNTLGYLPVKNLAHPARSTQQIFCLAVIKARRANDRLKFFNGGLGQCSGCGPTAKKLWRNRVYPCVCTLCRKHCGHQQLPCILGIQMGARVRITQLQGLKHQPCCCFW